MLYVPLIINMGAVGWAVFHGDPLFIKAQLVLLILQCACTGFMLLPSDINCLIRIHAVGYAIAVVAVLHWVVMLGLRGVQYEYRAVVPGAPELSRHFVFRTPPIWAPWL